MEDKGKSEEGEVFTENTIEIAKKLDELNKKNQEQEGKVVKRSYTDEETEEKVKESKESKESIDILKEAFEKNDGTVKPILETIKNDLEKLTDEEFDFIQKQYGFALNNNACPCGARCVNFVDCCKPTWTEIRRNYVRESKRQIKQVKQVKKNIDEAMETRWIVTIGVQRNGDIAFEEPNKDKKNPIDLRDIVDVLRRATFQMETALTLRMVKKQTETQIAEAAMNAGRKNKSNIII